MSIDTRLDKLERGAASGCNHYVVVNSDGDEDAARRRYESNGRTIRTGDNVFYVKTGIDRDPGDE